MLLLLIISRAWASGWSWLKGVSLWILSLPISFWGEFHILSIPPQPTSIRLFNWYPAGILCASIDEFPAISEHWPTICSLLSGFSLLLCRFYHGWCVMWLMMHIGRRLRGKSMIIAFILTLFRRRLLWRGGKFEWIRRFLVRTCMNQLHMLGGLQHLGLQQVISLPYPSNLQCIHCFHPIYTWKTMHSQLVSLPHYP